MKKVILYSLFLAILLSACSQELENHIYSPTPSDINSTASVISSTEQVVQPTEVVTPENKILSKEEAIIKLSETLKNDKEKFTDVAKYALSVEALLYVYNGTNEIKYVDNRQGVPIEIKNSKINDEIVSILKESDIVSISEYEGGIQFLSSYGSAGIHDNGPYSGFEYGIIYSKDGKNPFSSAESEKIVDNWYFYSILRL